MQLAQLLVGESPVWQVAEPGPKARRYLEAMKINEPTPILRME